MDGTSAESRSETRKAAIEPASRRAERLDRACSSTPASAAWRQCRESRYESGRLDHWLKVTNPAAPRRGGRQRRPVVHVLESWHLCFLLHLRAQLRHLRSWACLNVALVTGP